MSNFVLNTLKTGRQVAATAAIVLGAFGLPALMAGGVVLPDLLPAEAVEWMGTGEDDPVVTLSADLLTELNEQAGDAQADVPPPPKGGEPQPKSGEKAAPEQTEGALTAKTTRKTPRKTAAKSGPVRKAIDRNQTIQNRGSSAGSAGGTSRAKQAAIAARNKAKARGRRCKQPIAGINHLFGDRYTVKRDVLERYDSMEAAVGLARVAWNKDANGKTDGFKLYRVACGSPLTQVGLQTGDVIHKINGKKVRTLPAAFSAIRKVKRHDAVHVEFSRGGRHMARIVTIL